MSVVISIQKPSVDWLTVVAIATIAISLNVGGHEGVHALACLAVGGPLLEYSALYEECGEGTVANRKIVAGAAPTFNLLAGTLLWVILRRLTKSAPETWYFIWLLMLMNWFYGAGYFMVSGIAYIGDWAVVLDGWQPLWLWRALITVVGLVLYVRFIRLGLIEYGKMVGGDSEELYRHTNKLWVVSYISSFVVVLLASFFCPYGMLSLPVTAGLMAVLGACSPLIFMIRWFRTPHFTKAGIKPLEIRRKWPWLAAAVVVVFTYVFVLGRTLYF